jgi:hypothetical protein
MCGLIDGTIAIRDAATSTDFTNLATQGCRKVADSVPIVRIAGYFGPSITQ